MSDASVSKPKVFGVVGLAVFTFSFLANANESPQLATFGLGSILLFVAAIFLFLGPTAMASAEMGSTYPRTGGIYIWTRLAFGEGVAFMVIWLEFANFVVAWPGIMGTLTVQSAYLLDPNLANSPAFVAGVAILVTWLAAAMALRGLRVAQGFAWYSVVAGTVVPALMLIGFAIAYLVAGNPPAMEISGDALVPPINSQNVAFISGALLMFSGIEIAAIHAADVRDPGRTIPRANLIAVVLCFAVFAPLTLAIATVIPSDQINIVAGLVQSGEAMFSQFQADWLTYVLTFLLVTGLMASLIQILGGPSRGLLVAGKVGGNLPRFLQSENRAHMPVAIIIAQAAISSVLALGYGLLGSVQNAWFVFAIIQTNMTLLMYILMLAAVIKLRYSHPRDKRPFRIPGGWAGVWTVAGIGMITCLLALLVSVSPTEEAQGMSPLAYVAVVIGGTLVFAGLPFVFWLFRKPSWQVEEEEAPVTG
ncbi:MAG: APC family permease [Candidatus Nanopelagicales bacterium]